MYMQVKSTPKKQLDQTTTSPNAQSHLAALNKLEDRILPESLR